jgi:hypothetical protein
LEQNNFPYWLKPGDAFIAKALIKEGFWYVGIAEDYPTDEIVNVVEGWEIGFSCGESLVDCVIDGAMFCCEIDEAKSPLATLFSAEVAIQLAVEKWRELNGYQQLELPL